MVYGAINECGEEWYTKMGRVFTAIKGRQINYNWLITDMESVPVPPQMVRSCNGRNYCWLTGEELTRIVQEDDGQWVWAVLSGFEKEIPLSKVLKYPKPYADGYRGFWENPLSIQHPLASVEIVPWDAGLTLFFSREEAAVRDFMAFFPYSEDLFRHNAERIARSCDKFLFRIEQIYSIRSVGTAVVGIVEKGSIGIGDTVSYGQEPGETMFACEVKAIHGKGSPEGGIGSVERATSDGACRCGCALVLDEMDSRKFFAGEYLFLPYGGSAAE